MALHRYNFSWHGKVVSGRVKKSPYVVGWFQQDGQAQTAAQYYGAMLANGATVGVTKVTIEYPNPELPSPANLDGDMVDAKVLCRYLHPTDKTIKSDMHTVWLPAIKQSVTDSDIALMLAQFYVLDNQGTERPINDIINVSRNKVNVDVGSYVQEPMPAP